MLLRFPPHPQRNIPPPGKIAWFDPSEKVQHGRGGEIFPEVHRNHEHDRLFALPPAHFLVNRTKEDRGEEDGHGNAVFLGFAKERPAGNQPLRNVQAPIARPRAGQLEGMHFFPRAFFGLLIILCEAVGFLILQGHILFGKRNVGKAVGLMPDEKIVFTSSLRNCMAPVPSVSAWNTSKLIRVL